MINTHVTLQTTTALLFLLLACYLNNEGSSGQFLLNTIQYKWVFLYQARAIASL